MKTLGKLFPVIGLVIALSASSSMAGQLGTTVLSSYGDGVNCQIVNLHSKERDVAVELRNVLGVPVSSGSFSLLPGEAQVIGVNPLTGNHYCVFDVEGSPKKYRAALSISRAFSSTVMVVPAQ